MPFQKVNSKKKFWCAAKLFTPNLPIRGLGCYYYCYREGGVLDAGGIDFG